jgi:hypothetical protein
MNSGSSSSASTNHRAGRGAPKQAWFRRLAGSRRRPGIAVRTNIRSGAERPGSLLPGPRSYDGPYAEAGNPPLAGCPHLSIGRLAQVLHGQEHSARSARRRSARVHRNRRWKPSVLRRRVDETGGLAYRLLRCEQPDCGGQRWWSLRFRKQSLVGGLAVASVGERPRYGRLTCLNRTYAVDWQRTSASGMRGTRICSWLNFVRARSRSLKAGGAAFSAWRY